MGAGIRVGGVILAAVSVCAYGAMLQLAPGGIATLQPAVSHQAHAQHAHSVPHTRTHTCTHTHTHAHTHTHTHTHTHAPHRLALLQRGEYTIYALAWRCRLWAWNFCRRCFGRRRQCPLPLHVRGLSHNCCAAYRNATETVLGVLRECRLVSAGVIVPRVAVFMSRRATLVHISDEGDDHPGPCQAPVGASL